MAVAFHVRKLVKGDEKMLDAFLLPHTPFAYFMRSNVRKGGIVYEGKPYQGNYFGAFAGDGLRGVIAHHYFKSVQIFCPDKPTRSELAISLAEHLATHPREVTVILGPSDQVRDIRDALGFVETDFRTGRSPDYLYALNLAEMKIPELLENPDISVRLATKEDLSVLAALDHDFNVESLGDPPGQATLDKATERIARRIEEGDLFVLQDKGKIVSYCGAGGYLPDWKHVGPVYTPPDLRNRGYGRAVTAASLSLLRDQGATHAALFVQNPAAIRSYLALGFREIGDWKIALLKQPVQSFKLNGKNAKPINNVPAP